MRKLLNAVAVAALLAGAMASKAEAGIVFQDDFNGDHGGVANSGTLNYTGFANWNVTQGSVDLIGNGYFDFYPGHGLYVDLDGSTRHSGTIQTKNAFLLGPGNYNLSFDLGGSARGDVNTVVSSVNDTNPLLLNQSITLASNAGLTHQSFNFSVVGPISARIQFAQTNAGDNIGLILDNVVLTQVPEPASLLLFGSSILGLAAMGRRRKAG